MNVDERNGLRVYRFATVPAELVDALVSTRMGGTSAGRYRSLNLGLRVEDDPEAVVHNRRRLFASYDLPLERSAWCRQVHRDTVTVVDEHVLGPAGQRGAFSEDDVIPDTDALVTNLPGVPLCVTLADCVPVVIYDRSRHVLALAHAGWGGTVARIASSTVRVMAERYGSVPGELIAAIGPSIGPEHYEVGRDVVSAARAAFGERIERAFTMRADGRAQFDLWSANVIDLTDAGLPGASIDVAAISTAGALDEFYSHRAEPPVTGRMVAVAMLHRSPDLSSPGRLRR